MGPHSQFSARPRGVPNGSEVKFFDPFSLFIPFVMKGLMPRERLGVVDVDRFVGIQGHLNRPSRTTFDLRLLLIRKFPESIDCCGVFDDEPISLQKFHVKRRQTLNFTFQKNVGFLNVRIGHF